ATTLIEVHAAALRRRHRRDAEAALQPLPDAHTQPRRTIGVEFAQLASQARLVCELQPGETLLQPPAFLIADVDEGLVAQLVVPAPGLIAVGDLVHAALNLLATRSRADQADIQVQATGLAPTLVGQIAEHRNAREQQPGIGTVVLDQVGGLDLVRRVDLV